jgi:hypothetical protein
MGDCFYSDLVVALVYQVGRVGVIVVVFGNNLRWGFGSCWGWKVWDREIARSGFLFRGLRIGFG